MLMSAVEMREQVHQLVDEIDERLLKAVFLLMSSYQNEEGPIGYEMDGSPIYGSELGELLDQEVEAAKQGNYITVEELAKRSQKWLTRTK
jgi:hypothetical protein